MAKKRLHRGYLAARVRAQITPDEIDALRQIQDGADVHSYVLAKRLREVEQRFPELLEIGPLRMYKGDGTDRLPYFGAILTAKGRAVIRG